MNYGQNHGKGYRFGTKRLFVLWTFLFFMVFVCFSVISIRLMISSSRKTPELRQTKENIDEVQKIEEKMRAAEETRQMLNRQRLEKERKEEEKRKRLETLLKDIQDEGKKKKKNNVLELDEDSDDDDDDDTSALTSSDLKQFGEQLEKIIKEDEKKRKKVSASSTSSTHKMIKKRRKVDTSMMDEYIKNTTKFNFISSRSESTSIVQETPSPVVPKKSTMNSISTENSVKTETEDEYDEDKVRKRKEAESQVESIEDDEMVNRRFHKMAQSSEKVHLKGVTIADSSSKNETIDIEHFLKKAASNEPSTTGEEENEVVKDNNQEEEEENVGFMDEFRRASQESKRMEDYVKSRLGELDSSEIQEEERRKNGNEDQDTRSFSHSVDKDDSTLPVEENENKEMDEALEKELRTHLGLKKTPKVSNVDKSQLREATEHALEYVRSKREMRFRQLKEKYSHEEQQYGGGCSILVEPQVFISQIPNAVDIVWGAVSCEGYKPVVQYTQNKKDRTSFTHVVTNVTVSTTYEGQFCKCSIPFTYTNQQAFYRVIYVPESEDISENPSTLSDSLIHVSTKVETATLLQPHPRYFSSSNAVRYSIAFLGGRSELSSRENTQLCKAMQPYKIDMLTYLGGSELGYGSLLFWKKELFELKKNVQRTKGVEMLFIPGPYDRIEDAPEGGFGTQSHYAFTVANVRFIVLGAPNKEQNDWFVNTELRSQEFLSASFRVVLTHYTPFITVLTEEQKADHEGNEDVPEEYFALLTSPIDLVISGEQAIYERQQVYTKQFISLGFTHERLYRIDRFTSTLTLEVVKTHKENSFGVLQIYDCSLVFKSVNSRGQSLDAYIAKSQSADCSYSLCLVEQNKVEETQELRYNERPMRNTTTA